MCYAQEINHALRAARKTHICDWCGEKIEPKTKYWRWFGIVEGDLSDTKLHPECERASMDYVAETGTCWLLGAGHPRGAIDWEII